MNAAPTFFLTPSTPPPVYDGDLDDVLAATVAGMTGLPPELVRPRVQPDPPPQPAVTVDWCAVGVTSTTRDTYSSLMRSRVADETFQLRCEVHTVMVSFFGPAAEGYAAVFADGFGVEQNRYELQRLGMDLVSCGDPRNATAVVATENLRRFDVDFKVARRVVRGYAVPSIGSLSGSLRGEGPDPDGTYQIAPLDVGQ